MVLKARTVWKGTLGAVSLWSFLFSVSILPFFPSRSHPPFVDNLSHYFLFYPFCIFLHRWADKYILSHISFPLQDSLPQILLHFVFLYLTIYPGNHTISIHKSLPHPSNYCCIVLHNLFRYSIRDLWCLQYVAVQTMQQWITSYACIFVLLKM